MCRRISMLVVALVAGGCASEPYGPDPEMQRASAVHPVTTAMATPFYVVFKTVTCVATVAIAAPGSAAVALTDDPERFQIQESLDYGVAHNCGGSWIP